MPARWRMTVVRLNGPQMQWGGRVYNRPRGTPPHSPDARGIMPGRDWDRRPADHRGPATGRRSAPPPRVVLAADASPSGGRAPLRRRSPRRPGARRSGRGRHRRGRRPHRAEVVAARPATVVIDAGAHSAEPPVDGSPCSCEALDGAVVGPSPSACRLWRSRRCRPTSRRPTTTTVDPDVLVDDFLRRCVPRGRDHHAVGDGAGLSTPWTSGGVRSSKGHRSGAAVPPSPVRRAPDRRGGSPQ